MSFSVLMARTFGSMLVPQDPVGMQARQLIEQADIDDDGVIDLRDSAQVERLDALQGRGFAYADSLGSQNGVLSLRELRSAMAQYDSHGDPQGGGSNGAIEGFEWLRMVADVAQFPAPEPAQS